MGDRAVRIIDAGLFDRLMAEAAAAPRRRMNYNFHDTPSHPCNRFLNAVLPDSYVRPHRHDVPTKDELFVVLRGRLGLVIFEPDGSVRSHVALTAGGAVCGVDIPPGTWHTLVALDEGCIILEVKAGPYEAATEKTFAPFAPAEDAPEAAAYLAQLHRLFGAAA